MKPDQLMEAIENIDDRYIEECAYGVRRKSNIPWGMIITAACFCLAIGATIFLHNAGLLPHSGGPTESTVPPTTEFTTPYPTVALPEPEKFFGEPGSLHNTALGEMFESAEDVQFFCLLGKGNIGKGVDLTEQEKKLLDDKLKYGTDYADVWRLTKEQIDNAFWSVYGLTWEQVIANFDPDNYNDLGINYSIYLPVYLEETGYYYGYGGLETGVDIAGIIVEYLDDGLIKMHYSNRENNGRFVAMLQTHETGYHILSNTFCYSESTDPTDPVDTTPPTIPPQARPSVEEFFSDRGNWQNYFILTTFSDPTQIDLRPDSLRTMDGESTYATDLEHEKLASVVRGYSRNKLFRATKAQLDGVMLTLFNITTDQLTTDWEQNFTYLAETGCYYGRANNAKGYTVYIDRTEECDDGTILMYYALTTGEEPHKVARLQPHETGYYILSNETYVDNTGKSEDQITMETLFKGPSWYNSALTSEYDSPQKLSLLRFFYSGFKDEPQKPTDQEREQLEKLGVNLNYDLFRLPVDKMNEVLTEYFGITLADMEPETFGGLVYLESTNCYYHSASGWFGLERFEVLSVNKKDDGTICVQYQCTFPSEGVFEVTMKPNGDGYQILSNVLADPFRPYKVDAAQLNALLQEAADGNLTEQRKDEILLPLLGTFLEDPELFVDSLGKQQRSQTGVIHIFALRIKYTHPRYAAYNQTIRAMLPKVQSEEHKRVIYWMAFYSGLGNFLPQTPGAQDYALLFDMSLYSDGAFSESCSGWFKQYCMADPKAFTAAMAQTEQENWEFYAQRSVSVVATTQEERLQIKESMTQLVAELSMLDGYGVYDQIQCAQLIIEMCDKPIE